MLFLTFAHPPPPLMYYAQRYHSHPFDLEDYSHCFLSQTDLSTQLQWQRAEDPHGNPFVAIVIDPLRSVHTGFPEIKAFRAYPPEYNSPVSNQCPDGSVVYSEQKRLQRWGSCWNRYYELGIEYYMSSSARVVMEQLTQDYLWMRTLGSSGRGSSSSSSNDADYNKNMAEHLNKAANQFKGLDTGSSRITQISSGSTAASTASVGRSFGMSVGTLGTSSIATSASNKDDAETMKNAVQEIVQLANQELHAKSLQKTKQKVFSKTPSES
jgi:COP9 signalosome complex subunit 5